MSNRPLKSRRDALAEAPQSAQFYRQFPEAIPQMAWSARADGSIDFFNARVYQYTGRNHKQLEGWGWRAMVHPDDWKRCFALWTKAFTKGQPYEVEYRLRRRDGKYLWHLAAAMPLREGGRIVRWFGTSTDIENQKRAERLLAKARQTLGTLVSSRANQLKTADSQVRGLMDRAATQQHDAQEWLRSFLDSMPAIAWIKDSHLRYSWVSASHTRVHGKTLDELRGRDDFDLWPEPLAQHFRRNDEQALRVNGPVQCIDSVPFADGDAARWMVVKFPMPDGTGAPGVVGIGFDITARDSGKAGLAGADAGNPMERLSARERQVLQLIVNGCTSAEVGARLNLSPKSIDTYRSRLMAKLGIEDLPSLVKFAIRHGLTTIG